MGDLNVNGEIEVFENIISLRCGSIGFRTYQQSDYLSNIYILKGEEHCHSFVGLTTPESKEEIKMLGLMIKSLLERYQCKPNKLKLIGFGPHISNKIESLTESSGIKKFNTFFSQIMGSIKQKEFYENPANHKYFSGSFRTEGILEYSSENKKCNIKIIDSKSVHNGITYVDKNEVKFEGNILDSPRYLSRNKEDNISKEGTLERVLNKKGSSITYTTQVRLNNELNLVSENGLYLGISGEGRKHALLFNPPFFKISTEDIHQDEFSKLLSFKEYNFTPRGKLIIKDPILENVSESMKEFIFDTYKLKIN